MKSKQIVTLVVITILCITQFGCKKDNIETPAEPTKLYLPATLLVQNSITDATIFTATYLYNSDSTISMIEQVSSGNTLSWTFNYNANGTLQTVSHTNMTDNSYNVLFQLSYDLNDKLSRVIRSGYQNDTTNYNYSAGSKTYVGTGGIHDGLSLKLNAQGQLDKIQDWEGSYDINLTYLTNNKGVFVNANMDESVLVFLSIYHIHHLTHSFFHSQQLSTALWVDGTYTWQNYNRDGNGYITTFQTLRNSNPWQNYTVTYNDL